MKTKPTKLSTLISRLIDIQDAARLLVNEVEELIDDLQEDETIS